MIMGRRLKYRQCFMKANGVLAKGEGSLGNVKPNKEDRAYRISLLLFTLCFFLLDAVPALKILKEEDITKC
jgi:hypothetical protein